MAYNLQRGCTQTTINEIAIEAVSERYEEIMHDGLMAIMMITHLEILNEISMCSHWTKVRYEYKMRYLFKDHT